MGCAHIPALLMNQPFGYSTGNEIPLQFTHDHVEPRQVEIKDD